MDITTVSVIIIFALIVVVGFYLYRQRGKIKVSGPFSTSLELEASNPEPPPPPGVRMEDITSHSGGITAEDSTGRGAEMRRAEAYGDIRASSAIDRGEAHPKD
jgi:hypothetical protein